MINTSFQFVGFVTRTGPDQFIPEWEPYAKKLQQKKQEPRLLELTADVKNRYRYLSKHEWPDGDFNFSFMNKRKSEHFPELNVQVVQLGGYMPVLPKKKYMEETEDIRLLAFINHSETDIDFYRHLSMVRHLTVYEAYYESCTYGHIIEFVTREANVEELLLLLEKRPGVTAASYRECTVTA
ncbi:MAG TPA: hypothetical protein VMZ03_12985 [Chitinophagaceae bacterium]|nr:hypothetical protein [Chitinophagaceae bacterium]